MNRWRYFSCDIYEHENHKTFAVMSVTTLENRVPLRSIIIGKQTVVDWEEKICQWMSVVEDSKQV